MTIKRGKILSFANPKGGVGKSTISCLVTAMLKWTNLYNSVQLIDADKQGSSIRLLQRISNNIPCSHYPISYEYDKLNVILLEQLILFITLIIFYTEISIRQEMPLMIDALAEKINGLMFLLGLDMEYMTLTGTG